MADYPALPLWTDAYLADTMHMSVTESGAYLHLLMAAWRSPDCALPDDDKMLGRMARCTPREWRQVRDVVMAFWTLDDVNTKPGGDAFKKWTQKRLLREREYVRDKSEKAKRAADAKWRKNNETDNANAAPEHMPEPCPDDAPEMPPTPIPIPSKKEDTKPPPSVAAACSADPNVVAVVKAFEEIRERYWPNDSRLSAPGVTLAADAAEFLKAGGTPDLIAAKLDEQMAKAAGAGKAPPNRINAYRLSIGDAIAAAKAKPPGPNAPREGGFLDDETRRKLRVERLITERTAQSKRDLDMGRKTPEEHAEFVASERERIEPMTDAEIDHEELTAPDFLRRKAS